MRARSHEEGQEAGMRARGKKEGQETKKNSKKLLKI
jgi:hypothetical protein